MVSLRIRTNQLVKYIFITPILFYQKYLRKYHNRECIYQPTCSSYTINAILKYGVIKGWYFGVTRIQRCNGALYKGGVDEA